VAALKRQLPDVGNLTVEQGSQQLREAAMEKFKSAVAEMQTQVEKAQRQLADARDSGSASAIESATKNLQQVQQEQAGTLKRITADLQAQIELLERIKQP
jgi:F0F1-type ATP synthase membrane subunit b/b'